MATFDRLDRLTSRAVDRVNSIPFAWTPMKSTPNGRPSPDPIRRPLPEVLEEGPPKKLGPYPRGIFDDWEQEFGIQLGVRKSYREANDLRSLQVGSDPRLSIDMKYFGGPETWPRQGDVIHFPTRPEKPTYDVISAQPDSMNRIVLMLAQRGAKA